MSSLQALLNFHTRAIWKVLQEGTDAVNGAGLIESHFVSTQSYVFFVC